MSKIQPQQFAVVGSGPAGLMATYTLARAGALVTLFEKRKGLGRKLLVAGSSGLNITYDCPAREFHQFYTGPEAHFRQIFRGFIHYQHFLTPLVWVRAGGELEP